MNQEYQTRLRYVLRWMVNREYNIADINLAMSYIYKVIEARREYFDTITSEGEELAMLRLEAARKSLLMYLKTHCVPYEVRCAVVWLAEHTR